MIQVLLNGIIGGLNISLLATAFSLVYLPTKVFHIALGAVFAIVPYVVLQAGRMGLHPFVGIICGLSLAVVMSLLCELVNHRPLDRKQVSSPVHFVASLGTYIVVVQIIVLAWGSETRSLRPGVDMTAAWGGIVLTRTQMLAAGLSLAFLMAFQFWLRRTDLGLQFRALADNPVELALRGYNTERLRLLAFGISGLLCGISSLFVAYDVGFEPHVGMQYTLLAAVAVVVGGRSSFIGPALGGLILGLLRSEIVWFLSAKWQDAVTFLLLAVFLFYRPYGILGQKRRVEAEA